VAWVHSRGRPGGTGAGLIRDLDPDCTDRLMRAAVFLSNAAQQRPPVQTRHVRPGRQFPESKHSVDSNRLGRLPPGSAWPWFLSVVMAALRLAPACPQVNLRHTPGRGRTRDSAPAGLFFAFRTVGVRIHFPDRWISSPQTPCCGSTRPHVLQRILLSTSTSRMWTGKKA
jgi:hypothetical protein